MTTALTREQHLELYYYMRLNRELEEQMVRLFRQNKIVGGLYSGFGQEAISVGSTCALDPGACIAPMILNIGALLVRGFKRPKVQTPRLRADAGGVVVERTAREAVGQARAGHGPVLIEAKTMRMRGHAQHDAAEYVPKEMLEAWKKRDPLDQYEKFLNENKLWDAKTKKEIDARVAREIQADVEFAENSPFPPPELAGQGGYCEGCHTVEAACNRPTDESTPPPSRANPEVPNKQPAP